MTDTRLERAQKLLALADAAKRYAAAIIDSARAAEYRAALGTNTTRARMTTANARWMRCAEARDRLAANYQKALEELEGSHD